MNHFGQKCPLNALNVNVDHYNEVLVIYFNGDTSLLLILISLSVFPEYDLEPCQDPGTPRFGWHTGSRFGIGDSLAFYCNTGYRLQGAKEIVCLGGGRRMWSAPLPRCVGTWSAAFITFSFLFMYCRIYTVSVYLSGLQLKSPCM